MKTNKITLWLVLILFATACKKADFGDINVSPNNPSQPVTSQLLTNATRFLGRANTSTSTATAAGIINSVTPYLYTQLMSEMAYTSESRFATKVYDYTAIYARPLEDLQTIIDLNSNDATKGSPNVAPYGSNANQIAVARILKAFYFLNMTDRWGAIPYSEALKGMSIVTPKFDDQKSIYTSLFKELKEASAQFDKGTAVQGDILLSGNATSWKRFANTMRMLMAMRLSKVDPTTGRNEFVSAVTDANGLITDNSQNVVYKYLSESANENPYYYNYEVNGRYDYAPSQTLVDKLKAWNDPRLSYYADKNADGNYVGMPYGLTQDAATASYNIGNVRAAGNVSRIGVAFRSQNSPTSVYTYSNTLFTLAEAAQRGWYTGAGSAADLYVKGIRASLQAAGVADAEITKYLARPEVAYTDANGLEQILTQKWIGSFGGYGYEVWADWRRTGFPKLSPGPSPQSIDKQIPRRQDYTTDAASLNKDNYNAVLQMQGPDEVNTRIWWDTK